MVYLIHFDKPFKGVQHYIEYSADEKFLQRIEHHKKNTGSALLRAANKAGIKWKVVREWPGEDGNFERKLKNQKNTPCLCPTCKENKDKFRRQRMRSRAKLKTEII